MPYSKTVEHRWQIPDDVVIPEDNTADIWQGRLCQEDVDFFSSRHILSQEEQERSEKFVRAADRDLYIFSHGMLRTLLARYIGCTSSQIRFTQNEYGKPTIATPESGKRFHFNLSHSKDLSLIAVSCSSQVGIDVECIRELDDAGQLAERYFSSRERAYLNSLSPDKLTEAFFICWTLKESFIKAIGKGLSFPLDSFSVPMPGSSISPIIHCSDDSVEVQSWIAHPLNPQPGYSAAVTVGDRVTSVRFLSYATTLTTPPK